MDNYREIVTKAVLGKGKKTFLHKDSVEVDNKPTTVLGCWVINHNFSGVKQQNNVSIIGNYDINIWYSYDNDTKTAVCTRKYNYSDIMSVNLKNDVS